MRSVIETSSGARGSAAPASRASPYRVSARADVASEPRAPLDAGTVGVVVFVFACSLLRFGLFAFGAEHFGADPLLALAASAASAYYLQSLLGR